MGDERREKMRMGKGKVNGRLARNLIGTSG